jgi:DNA recombination protein RmuC
VYEFVMWGVLALGVINGVLLVIVLLRRSDSNALAADQLTQASRHQALLAQITTTADNLTRALRRNIDESARDARLELAQNLATFQQTMVQQGAEATRTQNTQIDAFGQQLALLQKSLSDTLSTQLSSLSESNVRRMSEVRDTLERQLTQLQVNNAAKLDEMRATVDEKLQSTLQARLGESFKQVADRLEQVHKGLGEMQTLAQGVGDLKHLLTNVKTRGMFGEAQLAGAAGAGFCARAVRRPGCHAPWQQETWWTLPSSCQARPTSGLALWLPIDAKFPNEDYERLLDAQGSVPTHRCRGWRARRWSCASAWKHDPWPTSMWSRRTPPTLPFCFCHRGPVCRSAAPPRPDGSAAARPPRHAGRPDHLLAMLSSLQMGFRTLALEKRSSEVWQVLGAVKTEFGKFGDVLAKVKSQTQTVLNTLDRRRPAAVPWWRCARGTVRCPSACCCPCLP